MNEYWFGYKRPYIHIFLNSNLWVWAYVTKKFPNSSQYQERYLEYKKILSWEVKMDDQDRDLTSKDEKIEDSLYHEIGHYLNSKSYNNFKEVYDEFNNICWDKNWKVKEDILGDAFVSEYAKTKPTEDFADTFKTFILYEWGIKNEIEKCKTQQYLPKKDTKFINLSNFLEKNDLEGGNNGCVLSPQIIKKFEFIDNLRVKQ